MLDSTILKITQEKCNMKMIMMIIHSCGCKKKRETLMINLCLHGMQCITSVIEMSALIVNLGIPL